MGDKRVQAIYSDPDVSIVVTHPQDRYVYIVVEKPERNPDPRFMRHVMNFYVLEADPEHPDKYRTISDFGDESYSISLLIGRRAPEKGMELYFWNEKYERLQSLKDVVNPGKDPDNKNYEIIEEPFNCYPAYARVLIDVAWGDPNMGWRSPA